MEEPMRAVPSQQSSAGRPSKSVASRAEFRPASGLVLLALLIMLILVAVGALAAAEVWSITLKREREVELLFIGNQYHRAIESSWKMAPGRRHLPVALDRTGILIAETAAPPRAPASA